MAIFMKTIKMHRKLNTEKIESAKKLLKIWIKLSEYHSVTPTLIDILGGGKLYKAIVSNINSTPHKLAKLNSFPRYNQPITLI